MNGATAYRALALVTALVQRFAVVAALVLVAAPAAGQQAPAALRDIGVDEHPGTRLPLTRTFIDEAGHDVPLGRFFTSDQNVPVLLVPGYFRCTMLCGVLAPNLFDALKRVADWTAGRDYRVILLSIDPREGPADAAARRKEAVDDGAAGWSLLTGPQESVDAVAKAIGFRYRYDPATDQFAHAAIVVALASDGTIARYLYGVRPEPDSLAAVLATARDHESAASLEQILVRCFHFSPALRAHAGLLANVLRGGAILIILALAGLFVFTARRAATDGGSS